MVWIAKPKKEFIKQNKKSEPIRFRKKYPDSESDPKNGYRQRTDSEDIKFLNPNKDLEKILVK